VAQKKLGLFVDGAVPREFFGVFVEVPEDEERGRGRRRKRGLQAGGALSVGEGHSTMGLQTPQRSKSEREDTMDILSCQFGRNLAYHPNVHHPHGHVETKHETEHVEKSHSTPPFSPSNEADPNTKIPMFETDLEIFCHVSRIHAHNHDDRADIPSTAGEYGRSDTTASCDAPDRVIRVTRVGRPVIGSIGFNASYRSMCFRCSVRPFPCIASLPRTT